MMKNLFVAAGLLLAATLIALYLRFGEHLGIADHFLSKKREVVPLAGTYCDPAVKVHDNPIIFVHGLHAGSWVWKGMSEKFCKEYGHSTYTFNLRQHTKREGVQSEGTTDIFDYLADVEVAIDEVTQKYGRQPIVIGHSMGALLALRSGRDKDLKALVLIAPAPPHEVKVRPLPWFAKRNLMEILEAAQRVLFDKTFFVRFRKASGRIGEWNIEKQKQYFAKLSPEPTTVVRNLILQSISVPLGSVFAPTLVVCGSVDDIITAETAQRVAEEYNATFIEMGGNGHFIIIEPGWEEVAEKIYRWLQPAIPAPLLVSSGVLICGQK